MPIPTGGVPPRAVGWILLAMAAAFAVMAVVRVLGHSPWPVIAIPTGLAVVIGFIAWAMLSSRPAPPASKSHKLAGPGGV